MITCITLNKFIKRRDNLNLFLVNQLTTYNKADISYESNNNVKNFSNICQVNRTFKCNMPRCNYCGKSDNVALLCFIKKRRENKNVSSLSDFYNKNHKNK